MNLKEQGVILARQWAKAGPEMEQVRIDELRGQNTQLALECLADAFAHALKVMPAREESGLVEMQRIFARLRNDSNI